MPAERTITSTRKPRIISAPAKPRAVRKPAIKNRPKTSAKPAKENKRSNLTLSDWLQVFEYIDTHPDLSQEAIVAHFGTRHDGALVFTQGTLSRKIAARKKLEERINDNPDALSSKRPRVVTRPDVERALYHWVKHLEGKGESFTGPMLIEKRKKFENLFDVPENERLTGHGWVSKFCKAYHIKDHRRHGEAGSVDVNAVERERIRVQGVLEQYAPKDRFNGDETGFFAFAPPDRGLATHQMSGKKQNKFRITLLFGCNADGSEKLPIFFIGKSKLPRCFNKRSPEQRGFYYRNNKTAWMTSALFEEWIKFLDIRMQKEKRKICLLLDNFSGHYIDYVPKNIHLEYFEPNMTSYVQPCDAGIIRCFKAHYRRAFCLRAIDLDDAGEADIYKIDLLEAMLMANEAWKEVQPSTIKHCWNHTKIQPSSSATANSSSTSANVPATPAAVTANPIPATPSPMCNVKAWEIVRDFATSDEIRLPEAERRLQVLLGDQYLDKDWDPVLKVVMDAENDVAIALEGLDKLTMKAFGCPISDISTHAPNTKHPAATDSESNQILPVPPPQLADLEDGLMNSVNELKNRRRIVGTLLTLDEMLNPVGEKEIGQSAYHFEGGDKEIVDAVLHEMAEKANADHNADMEVDSDDSDVEEDGGIGDVIQLCAKMEKMAIKYAPKDISIDLSERLRKLRAHLRRVDAMNAKQSTLDTWIR